MRMLFWSLCVLLAVALGAFAFWPQIDIETALALRGANGFIGGSAWARAARSFFNITPFVVLAAMFLLYGARRLGRNPRYAPTGKAVVFLALSLALGPGLVVNLGLKDHAHRPRPINTREFGGPAEFRPWYSFDGACVKNCSFASGEAAEAFWMVAPASLAPPPIRALALAGALAFGVGASLLRMAFGGHFLSDVTVAGLIAILIVLGLRMRFWPQGDAA